MCVLFDGVDIKVVKDGMLMVGDKVFIYDNMFVCVFDLFNNKDLNYLLCGMLVIFGENGELSIVKLIGKIWIEGMKIDLVMEMGDWLLFGSDGEINVLLKFVVKMFVLLCNDLW